MYLFVKGLLSPKIKAQNLRLLPTTSATHDLPTLTYFSTCRSCWVIWVPQSMYNKIICYAKIVDIIKMRALISKRAGPHLWVYIYVGTYLLTTPITYYDYNIST